MKKVDLALFLEGPSRPNLFLLAGPEERYKTRGLSKEAAEALLTTSFAEAIVQTIAFPEVVEDVNNILLKKLEANNA